MGVPVNSLVYELVGPAGVGKTAVLHTIAQVAPLVRTGVRIDRLRQFPAMVRSLVVLTPALLDMMFVDSRDVWPGLRHLGRLRALPAEVTRARASGHHAILMDEGPVFSLGRLSVFQGADRGRGPVARRWQGEVARWSSLLDGIIFLDAPNEILVDRIRQRDKPHQVKNDSTRAMYDFLDRYRAAYRSIVQRLTATGGVPMVELDTSTASIEQVATGTVAALAHWGVPSAPQPKGS